MTFRGMVIPAPHRMWPLLVAACAVAGPAAAQSPQDLLRDGRYREAADVAEAWLAENPNAPQSGAVAKLALDAWVREAIVARRTAVLQAYAGHLCYAELLDSENINASEVALCQFYLGLSEFVLGNRTGALAAFDKAASGGLGDRVAPWKAAAAASPGSEAAAVTGSGAEAALARYAFGGAASSDAPGSGERVKRVARVLAWASGGEKIPSTAVRGEDDISTGRKLKFYDPWVLVAYSRACAAHARRHAPDPASFTSPGDWVAWGRLSLLDGDPGSAAMAFAKAQNRSVAVFGDLAQAQAGGGSPVTAMQAVLATDQPQILAEAVLQLLLTGEPDWKALTGPVVTKVESWRASVQRQEEKVKAAEMRAGNWCAGTALWYSGDRERARMFLDEAYDVYNLGEPRFNPPRWLPEIVMGETEDLNTKTHVLRVVGKTADTVPYMDNTYSLLQTYYVHAFDEVQGDVR